MMNRMNRKISLGSAVVLMCFAVLLTFMITFVNVNNRYNKMLANTAIGDKVNLKLAELDKKAREYYIGEIDNQKLLDSIAEGYVRGLDDRYAEYMNAERFAEYMQSNQGKMVGIGVEVLPSEEMGGVIEITHVMADSPAERGGMIVGDYIYKVNSELVSSLGYMGAVDKVRGEKGTEVILTILRESEELELTFIRDEVKTVTVQSRLINNNIGYIRIKEFNKETPNEFIEAMKSLESLGALSYIFDVRYNPGGDLDGVTETLDYLLPEGPIIKYVSKDGGEVIVSSDPNDIVAPMAVLMNESTASAAELFCAALRDYEKAVLIGVKTYGKGTMQTIYPLSDRVTAFKITYAKYYPPFGGSYDGIGVYPHNGMEIKLPDELLKEKSFDKLTDEEDTQLQAAINVFK